MRSKLDNGEYISAERFHADFNQIIKNCCDYNPKGTAVYDAGQALKRLFEEKWRALPPLQPSFESEDEEDDEVEEERCARNASARVARHEDEGARGIL